MVSWMLHGACPFLLNDRRATGLPFAAVAWPAPVQSPFLTAARSRSSAAHLFVAAVDLLDHGFIGFQASARPRRSGGAAVKFARVPAAGFVFSVHYPLHRAEHDAQGAPPLLLRKAPRR
ncbi:MAG: hypothetical protein U1F67_16830 [Rubrivivax sp.]